MNNKKGENWEFSHCNFLNKNRRGLSAIIITLIIVGLSLVAVGIVWGVVSNLLQSSEEQTTSQYDTLFLDMKVEKVAMEDDGISVSISRGSGGGTISGVAITISDGENTKVIKREVSDFEQLEQKTFSITSSEMGEVIFVKSVSVSPLLQNSVGNVLDSLELTTKEVLKSWGAVSWWRLNGNAQDEIGNNHGTIEGGVEFIDGKYGKSASFDGIGTVDGIIHGGNIAVPESVTNTTNYPNGCTYSLWINVDTDAVDRMSLFYGASTIRHIEILSSSKYFRTEAAKENQYSFGTGVFPDNVRGKWSHFVIVFANEETNRPVRWYQNGKLFYTGSMDGGTYPNTEYFSFNKIGRSTGIPDYPYAKSFDGQIDEVMIFNRALTDKEVESIYNLDLSK